MTDHIDPATLKPGDMLPAGTYRASDDARNGVGSRSWWAGQTFTTTAPYRTRKDGDVRPEEAGAGMPPRTGPTGFVNVRHLTRVGPEPTERRYVVLQDGPTAVTNDIPGRHRAGDVVTSRGRYGHGSEGTHHPAHGRWRIDPAQLHEVDTPVQHGDRLDPGWYVVVASEPTWIRAGTEELPSDHFRLGDLVQVDSQPMPDGGIWAANNNGTYAVRADQIARLVVQPDAPAAEPEPEEPSLAERVKALEGHLTVMQVDLGLLSGRITALEKAEPATGEESDDTPDHTLDVLIARVNRLIARVEQSMTGGVIPVKAKPTEQRVGRLSPGDTIAPGRFRADEGARDAGQPCAWAGREFATDKPMHVHVEGEVLPGGSGAPHPGPAGSLYVLPEYLTRLSGGAS